MPAKKSVDDQYKKMTPLEHIMARPDMYIGTVMRVTEDQWVFDDATEQMTLRKLTWVPGLYKIYDEIIVNAADNKIRDPSQSMVAIDISQESGRIRVWNNGEGIPVQIHGEHKMWIPEMIFGHLLTSSNYDDTEAKVTGGRNGYGAKLTNVFSKKFEVETYHKRSGKKFFMRWRDNMTKTEEAIITPVPRDSDLEDYTMVTFWPDFAKFGMESLEDDVHLLMKRRAYDVAGTTDKTLKVKLNGKTLPIKCFQDYVDLFPTMGEEKKSASYSRVNERWEVCVRPSNIGFQAVSFVNSIATNRGGEHVKYIADQVIDKVIAAAKKKKKDIDPKPHMIRPHLWIFINCLIENPSFDSQTKETLKTTKPNFGSDCPLPNAMIDYLLKSGIVERTIETANSKLVKQLSAKVKSSERGRVTGVPKLEDANDAGTRYSAECTLILTEGDSAKALAVSGLGTVGRDRYGVFPLRGKPLNVRDASLKKVMDCEEIQSVMKIVGLKVNTEYTSLEQLRYGRIMIMADQDHDGSHIKGLLINFIHFFWPSLIKIPGFLTQFITPIVKARPTKGPGETYSFFSIPDFFTWRKSLSPADQKKYTYKYYKGLGTSTAAEGREYFQNLAKHKVDFVRNSDEDEQRIIMAFAKDKIEERKRWITNFASQVEQDTFDFRIKKMTYSEFIDKELILFSMADCERSIPSIVDGLKPGQRKIMFCCFKRNLVKSIKVAQLAGYVSEHAAYHHGEASLNMTIVGLAQDFVGSNNVPLLLNDGQFGTRLQGGKDSASARYIFTNLQKVARAIFHPADDFILDYKDDDGFPVEPHIYIPVIPMVLVNGCSGIGTGFATKIPSYSPFHIIDNLRKLLNGEELAPMTPWYYGFRGQIECKGPGKFVSKGVMTVSEDGVINVTELPIESWTGAYKKFLEDLIEKELVIAFREYHTDSTVDFDIVLHPEVLRAWVNAGQLEEKLELSSFIHATNIIGFNPEGKLTKYNDAEAVIKEFYLVRLDAYHRRKQYMLADLRKTVTKLRNMMRFVQEVIAGSLVVHKKKKADLLKEIRTKGYLPFPPESKKKHSKTTTEVEAEEEAAAEKQDQDPLAMFQLNLEPEVVDSPEVEAAARDYDYLLGMRIWSLTDEMIVRLQNQVKTVEEQLRQLEATDEKDIWREDLNKLEVALKQYFARRDKDINEMLKKRKPKRPFDMVRMKIPILGDKARGLLRKEQEKTDKKSGVKKEAGLEDGGAEGSVPPQPGTAKKKPAPKRRRKKKSSDDDDDDDSDSSVESAQGPESSDDDDDDDDGESPAPAKEKKAAAKPKAPPKPRAKKTVTTGDDATGTAPKAKKPRAEKSDTPAKAEDDVFDLDAFGIDAIMKPSSQPIVNKPKPVSKPSFVDEDDDLLLGLGSTSAGTAAPASTAAPKKQAASPPKAKKSAAPPKKQPAKRKRKDSDDDDDSDESDTTESSASSSEADSADSESSWDDDDDDDDDDSD